MELSKELVSEALNNLKKSYQKMLMVNLTTDTFVPIIVPDDECYLKSNASNNISGYWDWFCQSNLINEEDKDRFESFIRCADAGKHIVYRRKLDNSWRYVLMRLTASVNYSNSNRECVLYVMDIHDIYSPEYDAVVERIGCTDNFTGLLNKVAFQRDCANCPHEYIGVAYADINGLKYTNDNEGHKAGDALILRFSNLLKLNFDGARCYHISGDEFVVLSYDCDVTKFLSLAIRFHKSMWNAQEFPMASIGYSVGRTSDIENVIDEAERQMYEDKDMFKLRYSEYARH